MNLISCGCCGVVLDLNRIEKPEVYTPDTNKIIVGNAIWDGDEWVSAIFCPQCECNIIYETGEIA